MKQPFALLAILTLLPGASFAQTRETLSPLRLSITEGTEAIYPGIEKGSLTFSPDATKHAYVVRLPAALHVVINGKQGEGFRSIARDSVKSSPDSQHTGF